MLNRLLREHAKLRSLGDDLVALVSASEPCDFDALAQRRWELARTVHQHLAYEERQVFRRLKDDPRHEARAEGAQCRHGIEQLHTLYKAHVEAWTATEVTSRWPVFQTTVKVMVARMKARLDHEEQNLFPLVEGSTEIEARWEPGTKNWAGDGVAMQPFIRGVIQPGEASA